ncbi:MAG: hypothetical protein K2O34_15480 [Acetatifactor sp.]|nr:hypothetical protein [Acetatifactor sp.]
MTEKKRKKDWGPALSLWALLARCSIYKVLAVLAVMVSTETVLFYKCLRSGGDYYSLTAVMENSHLSAVFLAALGLVYILAWTEGRLDTKSSAFMQRLRLSGSGIFIIKTAYNMACILMLFMTQIWLAVWLINIYGREMAQIYASPQRLFLAFYRIDFLHCLLPMADMGKWVRNLLLLLAFGMETARGAGRNYIPLIPLYSLTVSLFVSSMGGNMTDLICGIMYIMTIAFNILQVWKAEREGT